LNDIFQVVNVGIVPPVWYDNGHQVFYEFQQAGIPTICSDVGGMKDFIQHGVNWFLYGFGSADQLAQIIAYLYEHRGIIPRLAANAKPPKGIDEHAREIIKIYENILSHHV